MLKSHFIISDQRDLSPGWPDWANLGQFGYFWRLIMIFWKDKVDQSDGNILGYFLKQIYYNFT